MIIPKKTKEFLDKIDRLLNDTYTDGQLAYEEGKTENDCPYTEDEWECRHAWLSGYWLNDR